MVKSNQNQIKNKIVKLTKSLKKNTIKSKYKYKLTKTNKVNNSNKTKKTLTKRNVSRLLKSKNINYNKLSNYILNNKNNKNLNPAERILYMLYKELGQDDPTLNDKQNGLCRCVKYEYAKNKDGSFNPDVEINKCNSPVKPGTDFCEKHQKCQGFLKQFLSGSEPKYNPQRWSDSYTEGSHNCYAYFLDDVKDSIRTKCQEICLKRGDKNCPKSTNECQTLIPQPGDYFLLQKYGSTKKKDRNYNCPNMVNKILADNPTIKPARLTEKCPTNYYKGAMVIETGSTFHFYRQNPDATWSHKPGILPVTDKDASDKKIYIPHYSDRDYKRGSGGIFYDGFCGYFCIPNDNFFETRLS